MREFGMVFVALVSLLYIDEQSLLCASITINFFINLKSSRLILFPVAIMSSCWIGMVYITLIVSLLWMNSHSYIL